MKKVEEKKIRTLNSTQTIKNGLYFSPLPCCCYDEYNVDDDDDIQPIVDEEKKSTFFHTFIYTLTSLVMNKRIVVVVSSTQKIDLKLSSTFPSFQFNSIRSDSIISSNPIQSQSNPISFFLHINSRVFLFDNCGIDTQFQIEGNHISHLQVEQENIFSIQIKIDKAKSITYLFFSFNFLLFITYSCSTIQCNTKQFVLK